MSNQFGYNIGQYAVDLFVKFETFKEEDNSRIAGRIDQLTSQLSRVERALSAINKDRPKKESKKADKVDYSHSPEFMELFDSIRKFSFDLTGDPQGETLSGDTLFAEANYVWEAESLDRLVENLQNHVKILNSLMQKETIFQTENQYVLKDAMQAASPQVKGQSDQNEYIIRKTGRTG